ERRRQRRRVDRDEGHLEDAGREVDDREREPLGRDGYQGRTAVEDQQPDPGDLTTEVEDPKVPVGKSRRTPKAQPPDAEPETEGPADALDTDDTDPPEPGPEPVVLVPHRPAGRKLVVAAAVASA